MSPPKACAVNDGTMFASAFMRSGRPADVISSLVSTCTGEELVSASMPLARVPVTMTVSVMSAASMVIAALAVVEADAVVSASCASNIAGVQANGATIVDLISQLFARSLTHEKISLGFKFYSSPDASPSADCPRMKQDLRGSPCTNDSKVASGKNVNWCCNFPANTRAGARNVRGRVA